MARPLRIEFPGAVYHITSRGNARLPIFEDITDRNQFLKVLAAVVKRFKWRCHAYCLLNDHYHLVIETVEPNLSQGMRQLNGIYTQNFNRRHNQGGHIFQGRYKGILLERDNYLLPVCRYVVLNPVRSGLVRTPEKYFWSSYLATAGLEKRPAFLQANWILSQFDGSREKRRQKYREFIQAGIQGESPWKDLKAQCILGSSSFIEKLKPALKDKSDLREIPTEQRLVFRPPLSELFPPSSSDLKREERNLLIRKAHLENGYSLAAIARHIGLHYSTISRIVNEKSAAD
jgi:REP element-mobilizing transposase RayT